MRATVTQLVESMRQAWAAYVRARYERKTVTTDNPQPRANVYASQFRECTRRMLYDMTQWHLLPPFEDDVLGKFLRGEDREFAILNHAQRVGQMADPRFEIIGQQQRFELRDRKGRVAITGKTDARVYYPDLTELQLSDGTVYSVTRDGFPGELKAWAPHLVDRIQCFEDLFNSPWTKTGAYQLLCYLYGSNQPLGFMILDRAGLPQLLPVELFKHLDKVEAFLAKAEEAMDCKEFGELPGFLAEAAECQRCPFYGAVCNPPLKHAGARVLTDPEIEATLNRYLEIQETGSEAGRLWKTITAELRGVEQGICGDILIEGKWGNQTVYDFPPDVEKQIEAWKKAYGRKDPKGRFTLTVTRLSEAAKSEAA